MIPELEGYHRQIATIKSDAQSLVAGLTEVQFYWRPAPKRWSIGECLDHLNVSVRVTLPAFDRAILDAQARGLSGQGPFKYGRLATWIVRSQEPPVKWRFKTFRKLLPASGRRLDELMREFMSVRDELVQRLRRSDGLDLKRARIISPVNWLLRMPLGAYFAFILAHDRRHLWQARQVLGTPGFGSRTTPA